MSNNKDLLGDLLTHLLTYPKPPHFLHCASPFNFAFLYTVHVEIDFKFGV